MYSQSELNQINDIVCDNIELLVIDLGLDVLFKNDKLVGLCPIHSSDNGHGFQMYLSGHTKKGNWYCQTNHCENYFCANAIGLTRGILSARQGWPNNPKYSFTKTVDYIRTLYGINTLRGESEGDAEKKGGPPLYWPAEYWRKEMPICALVRNIYINLLCRPLTL